MKRSEIPFNLIGVAASLLASLLAVASVFAQDAKLTALPALTTATGDDLLYIVDDPSGTPTSKKITVANLFTSPAMVTPTITSLGNTINKSIWFGAGSLSTDGTNCAAPAEATPLASSVKLWTIICTDNDASRIHGSIVMPDSWNAGTLTFALNYMQTAADTNAFKWTVAAQCIGDGETMLTTANYGTPVDVTDAAVTGSNKRDTTTSGPVTPAGTCAGGDFLSFYIDVDQTGTTTAMATFHILGVKVEYGVTALGD